MKTDREKYRRLCKKEEGIPLFSRDWWLDAVAGKNNWDVAIAERDGQIVAGLPYIKCKVAFFKLLNMPKITPYLGIWVKYPEDELRPATKLSFEKKIFNKLIDELPKFHYFNLRFHYNITNWLPFFWQGFKQTTRYTYTIDDISDINKVYDNFKGSLRTDIRNAEKILKIEETEDIEMFYDTYKLISQRQNETPVSFELIKNLNEACSKKSCRKMLFAMTLNDQIAANLYLVWDKNSAYHLIGGYNQHHKVAGAVSLLLWKAIQFASGKTKRFDFKGSMIEPVERFYRAFGGIPTPYFRVYKINSTILKFYSVFKGII